LVEHGDVSPEETALRAWCVGYVADMLERAASDIDPNTRFSRIGLDSAMSVQLAVALEEHLGIQVSPDLVGDHPTISRLAAHLAARCKERARSG
jgi:acyl carrier protein